MNWKERIKATYKYILLGVSISTAIILYGWYLVEYQPAHAPRVWSRFSFADDYQLIISGKKLFSGKLGVFFTLYHKHDKLIPATRIDTWSTDIIMPITFKLVSCQDGKLVAVVNTLEPGENAYLVYNIQDNTFWSRATGPQNTDLYVRFRAEYLLEDTCLPKDKKADPPSS